MPPKSKGKSRRDEPREPKEFEEHTLRLDRVTRVVKGGRRMRFRASVIIGDRAGRVGFGMGTGADVQIANRKASHQAKKKLITIPIVGDTLPHGWQVKFKAAQVRVLPAAAGTGLIAGGAVRKILELAGVKNVLSKNIGTGNSVVVAQATMKLLSELKMTTAAKKFLAELKKQREEEQRATSSAREESSRAGRKSARSAPEKKVELKEAVAKPTEEKGRLEEESEQME